MEPLDADITVFFDIDIGKVGCRALDQRRVWGRRAGAERQRQRCGGQACQPPVHARTGNRDADHSDSTFRRSTAPEAGASQLSWPANPATGLADEAVSQTELPDWERELLAQLQVETFILDTEPVLTVAPVLEGFETRLNPDGNLEVDVEKSQGLNGVFSQLDQQNIRVLSMRTKSNRLEELFIRLVEENARPAEVTS